MQVAKTHCLHIVWFCLLSFRLSDSKPTSKQLKLFNSIKVHEDRRSFELMFSENLPKLLDLFNDLVKEHLVL